MPADDMSDADELRIMAQTLAPMNRHLAARLLVIAGRLDGGTSAEELGREVDDLSRRIGGGPRTEPPPPGPGRPDR